MRADGRMLRNCQLDEWSLLLNERNLFIHCEINVEQITIEGEKSVQLYETTAANQETNEFKK